MSTLRCLNGAALAALALMLACAKPPTQEMAAADNAIKAAIQAGAKDYAPDDTATAETALGEAQSKVAGKDYKGAKAAALDAKAKAEAAGAAAAANMQAAQAQVQQGMEALKPQLEFLVAEAAGLKIKGADQAKADAGSLSEQWQAIVADFSGGQFLAVSQKLVEFQTRIDALRTSIEEAKKAAATPVKKRKGRR